jgi:hypothetical protein
LPREACDGLMESLIRQIESLGNRRRNRAPLLNAPPAIDFGIDGSVVDLNKLKSSIDNFHFEIPTDPDNLTEDMETFALNHMATLLAYLDPTYPLLANVSSVKSLGRNRGIKLSDDIASTTTAALKMLKSRFATSIPPKFNDGAVE